MSDRKQALIEEKQQLNEKIEKLESFIGSEAYQGIDPFQMSMLHIQLNAMHTYSQVLVERIIWIE